MRAPCFVYSSDQQSGWRENSHLAYELKVILQGESRILIVFWLKRALILVRIIAIIF